MPADMLPASSPMPLAATRGRATSSTTEPPSGRSACASGSAIRTAPSSSAGHPTSAYSAARRTSTSPETGVSHGDVRAAGDQGRDPSIGEETSDSRFVVDRPDPRRDALALAIPKHCQVCQLLVDGEEVGVAALQPASREQLAQSHSHLQPWCESVDVLANGKASSDLRELFLDRTDHVVARRDDEPVQRRAVEDHPHDLGLVAGLLQVEVKSDSTCCYVEQLVEGQRLGTKLVRQLAVREVVHGPAGEGAVVVVDDRHAVHSPAHVKLDEVDAELDRVAVAVSRRDTGESQPSAMRAYECGHSVAAHIICWTLIRWSRCIRRSSSAGPRVR